MWMPLLFLSLAYLLGSISGSLLLGRFRGVDIRTQGSGNAGGTNALRTLGWRFALGVVLIDIGKGALATWLMWRFVDAQIPWLIYASILAAVIGHVWPIFHGFRGGKGLATLAGGLLIAWPWSLLPFLGVWVMTILLTGYVGLASILASVSLIATAIVGADSDTRLLFAGLTALLIVYTHRGNLARMRAGNENRFERARLLGRLFFGKRA